MNSRHLRPEDLRGRRWRGLVRESSQDQAEKWSPERQRSDLRRAAEELGLVAVEPLFYERTGSGEAERAIEVTQALADARAAQYDVLMVLATSRLARNRTEAVRVKAEARKIGLVVYFVAERLISGSFAGHLMEGISEVLDEHANEDRRFWIAGGLREKQLSGRWVGDIPLGYRRRLEDRADGTRGWEGRLDPDPVYGAIVGRIFTEYLAGQGTRIIARRLNAEGIRTTRGNQWRAKLVGDIVQNPAYKGDIVRYRLDDAAHYYPELDSHDGRRTIPSAVPALVSAAVWDKAQEIVAEHLWPSAGGRRSREYPLSRILRCGCGRALSGVFSGRRRYYRCPGRFEDGTCDAPGLRADEVEAEMARWLNGHRLPPDWRSRLVALRSRVSRDDAQERRERLTAQLVRLRNLYQWGDIPDAEYRAQAQELRSALAETSPAPVDLTAAAEAITEIGTKWARLPPERKRALPALIFRSIVARGGRIAEWIVRAELRPIIESDWHVAAAAGVYSPGPDYTVRFSA